MNSYRTVIPHCCYVRVSLQSISRLDDSCSTDIYTFRKHGVSEIRLKYKDRTWNVQNEKAVQHFSLLITQFTE